ncbi:MULTISPECIES: TetR family transcriptional regulator [Rhodococcus]|uniref:TetR family transcriptional regulator n=1 Tax=Rhodococcus oxybenzonivorans TaxID=1990687 RepID=A0AAE4V4L5_9NOCA|nr:MULTISPECIES: TetR family transcriptional regulator [Rhodococcus]MDV7243258.1 TetR family transcriptional regulator [Rhodococcus oxybenzonivorans]MDV7268197.1 TetR family transcriptional regulator [Rhodococcus oxybenzonivorans]MDV7276686.1 TetR family transcriptional regulator [Rhodococcus oxybenzonivorans]MDV7334483.1 TetR family transcriptional regulator [Rhodococcus oxybenzonivorans]MDV7344637.1 TetR family transcriptional regulator [Rhodococcus oxybenzonivorans]
MPRIAEVRDAAEPSSEEQRARHVRMLEAAAELASEKELARVQMHEVAKRAGVAIGTLYRYFPSKTHLFVAVMVDQIDQMGAGFSKGVASDTTPQDAVYNVLVRATRGLLRRPALSTAMIQSTSTANVATVPDAGKVDRAFRQIMLDAAGIEDPTEGDLTALRLVVQLWFGVVQSCLNGRISIPDAESDIRKGCDLLLVGLSRR